MTATQIAFRTDTTLKNNFIKKAKQDGFNLKVALNHLLRAYTENKIRLDISVNVVEPEIEDIAVTPELQKKMNHIGALLSKKTK